MNLLYKILIYLVIIFFLSIIVLNYYNGLDNQHNIKENMRDIEASITGEPITNTEDSAVDNRDDFFMLDQLVADNGTEIDFAHSSPLGRILSIPTTFSKSFTTPLIPLNWSNNINIDILNNNDQTYSSSGGSSGQDNRDSNSGTIRIKGVPQNFNKCTMLNMPLGNRDLLTVMSSMDTDNMSVQDMKNLPQPRFCSKPKISRKEGRKLQNSGRDESTSDWKSKRDTTSSTSDQTTLAYSSKSND